MEIIKVKSSEYTEKNTNSRSEYNIVKFCFSDLSKNLKYQLDTEANNLVNKANPNSASEGKERSLIQRKNDAFAGLLAEYAVLCVLNFFLPNSAERPIVNNSKDQIDIEWRVPDDIKYNIEVRSSFVKNGLLFGLFGYNPEDNASYFDVIGPYRQDNYKKNYESVKDWFFRVLFVGKKMDVYNRFIKNNESFYIIGAMSGNEIININKHKTLKPGSAIQKSSDFSGDYFVAPIDKIKDINQFIEKFSLINKRMVSLD